MVYEFLGESHSMMSPLRRVIDSKNGHEVMQLLSQLNAEGTTVVMVTHSQRDASFANRVINLFDGHIVESVEM